MNRLQAVKCVCGRWARHRPCYWCRVEAIAETHHRPVEDVRLDFLRDRLTTHPGSAAAMIAAGFELVEESETEDA